MCNEEISCIEFYAPQKYCIVRTAFLFLLYYTVCILIYSLQFSFEKHLLIPSSFNELFNIWSFNQDVT